jgi:hypothetical protein
MRITRATFAILLLIGSLSLWQSSAADEPESPQPDDAEARALLKSANEGLSSLIAEIDVGNVPLTPDLMNRWCQWIRRVYDASVLANHSAASRLKAAQEYLQRAQDMEQRLKLIKSEGDLMKLLGTEPRYHMAAAKLEIARIKREGAGN